MGRVCTEVQEWVEEEIEQPVETFVNQLQQVCEEQDCNWWCLCCNKWLCWLAWVVVRVVTWVIVTVGKWVTRVVCEVVNAVLGRDRLHHRADPQHPHPGRDPPDHPQLGHGGHLAPGGVPRFRRFPGRDPAAEEDVLRSDRASVGGTPIAPDSEIMRQVNAAIDVYDRLCNINMIFTGICHTDVAPPEGGLVVGCDAGGFFGDWWLAGSYFEFAGATCKRKDSFRRVIGLGSEILVFIVQDVTPANTNGCSFTSTHNYVVVEAKPTDQDFVAAHEIGHACWLTHDGGTGNLMNSSTPAANPTLTGLQISVVRWSKHCVYF